MRSAQKNHYRLGILISNINMSSWYLLTEKDFSPRQQNLVFPQVAFLLSFIIIICGFRLEGDNLGTLILLQSCVIFLSRYLESESCFLFLSTMRGKLLQKEVMEVADTLSSLPQESARKMQ